MIIVCERMADRVSSTPDTVMFCSLRIIVESTVRSYLSARAVPMTIRLEFAEGQLPLGFRGDEPTSTEKSLVGRPIVMLLGISSSVPWVSEGFGMKSIGVAACTSSIAASMPTVSSWMVPPIGNA